MAIDRKRIYGKGDRPRQLRAFCHAARLENFTRAAEHLGISQPSVSHYVRELTYELEAVLFERSGQHTTLTRAGERLYRLAWPLVEAMDNLPDTFLGGFDERMSGEVCIAAAPSVVDFILAPFLKRLGDEYPGIRVQLKRDPTMEGLNLLSANEVDFVFGVGEAASEDFLYRPVCHYDLVFITPEDHPLAGRRSVSFREASAWPAVVPSADTYARQIGESLPRSLGMEIKIAVEANGWIAIKEFVAAGLGISLLPSLCLTPKDRLCAIPPEPALPGGSYGVFTHHDHPLSLPAERFVQLVMAAD